MKIPKTETEMAFEEFEFQLKKVGNTLLATWLGKFLVWCVESLNRLLTPRAPDFVATSRGTAVEHTRDGDTQEELVCKSATSR